MKICIVIPYYNEDSHINKLLKDLLKFNLPVVIVDDGSQKPLKTKNIKVLRHEVNLGKGAAMKTGAMYAFNNKFDYVIFMDADGQHSPDDLKGFVEKIYNVKCDVVFGNRISSFGVPLVRYLGNKFASVLMGLFFGIYVSDSLCGFRAISKNSFKKIMWESDGYGVEIEMIARVAINKLKFIEIPIQTIYLNNVKGVTLLDSFSILLNVVKWRLTI